MLSTSKVVVPTSLPLTTSLPCIGFSTKSGNSTTNCVFQIPNCNSSSQLLFRIEDRILFPTCFSLINFHFLWHICNGKNQGLSLHLSWITVLLATLSLAWSVVLAQLTCTGWLATHLFLKRKSLNFLSRFPSQEFCFRFIYYIALPHYQSCSTLICRYRPPDLPCPVWHVSLWCYARVLGVHCVAGYLQSLRRTCCRLEVRSCHKACLQGLK